MKLPGVYEAKSLGFTEQGELNLLIPQIFGTDPVPASAFVERPEDGARGFVSFISGQPEYPVWLGTIGKRG